MSINGSQSNKINAAQLNFSAQNALCLPTLPQFFVVNSLSLFSGARSDMSIGDTDPFLLFCYCKKKINGNQKSERNLNSFFLSSSAAETQTMSCAELKLKSLSERQVWLMHRFFKSLFWVFSWYVSAYWSIAFGNMNCLIL